jgi:hydroxyacylglutathione hydrolase
MPQVHVIRSGRIFCNCIALFDPEARDAVLIDPSDDAAGIVTWLRDHDLHVRHILLTHAHPDHVGDIVRAVAAFSVAPKLHPADLPYYREFAVGEHVPEPEPLEHGQIIDGGPDLQIEVLHVPGHTPGSVAFRLRAARLVFCGDTLFFGAVGRSDVTGGDPKALRRSIQDVLYALPDDTTVHPGHGPTTTIGHEKRHNPFVRARS